MIIKHLNRKKRQHLEQLVASGEIEKLSAKLKKGHTQVIETGSDLISLAIEQQQKKSLKTLLQHTDLEEKQVSDYIKQALQLDESLPLITALLQHNDAVDFDPIMQLTLQHCSDERLPLHINLYLAHGAPISSVVVASALHNNNQPLIYLLFNSGAELPDKAKQADYPAEGWRYAKKCLEDKKIREMFL